MRYLTLHKIGEFISEIWTPNATQDLKIHFSFVSPPSFWGPYFYPFMFLSVNIF